MSAARTLLLATLLVALGAGIATAKQIQRVQVCGESQCFTFDRANSGGKLDLFEDAGYAAATPSAAAPWYRLVTTIGAGPDEDIKPFSFTDAYVPSANLVRRRAEGGGYEWFEVIDDLKPVLRNVSAGLEPLPGSTLRGLAAEPQPVEAGVAAGGTSWYWIVIGGVLVAAALGYGLRHRDPPGAAG